MEDDILIDFNLDKIEQNINTIAQKLSRKYSHQEYFIKIIKDNLKQALLGNKDAILKLDYISCMLPKIIEKLGLPFADLLKNNSEILNYYIENCNQNKNIEIIKKIILNFIEVFNFQLTDINPIDNLKEQLKNANININNIPQERRQNKQFIETTYDELEVLYNTWKISLNVEKGCELDEHCSDVLQTALIEKNNKIKTVENKGLYSKATIEFLKEKLKKIEDFINWEKVSKPNNKTSSPQNAINDNKSKINENDKANNNKNCLTEEEKQKLREIELRKRTSFYKDEYLAYGEDQSTEFKNYFYPLEPDQEKEIKRQYIGFLNSEGGRIYIGINDEKIVKGILLTYKNCDNYRNYLVGLSNDFYPKCRLDKIKVYFIPIKNSFNNKFINNLYVVKIIILPGDRYSLYSITKKGGFISAIRKQSQVFNLDAEEITNLIIERNNLKREQENNHQIDSPDMNLDFNDPEPETNLEASKNDLKSLDSNSDKSNNSNKNNKNNKNNKGKTNQKVVYVVNVQNIDKNLKVKDINKIFNGLQQSYQRFFSKEGKSIGYGKLHFNTEELAKAAILKFNGNNLGGKRNIVMSLQKNKFFNRINK